ncbi:hypothetical protein [Schaalia suimastitidis]|uniref:hypothetical protein n=1 Tax=Schaalia suimastitidis TaxID=121163 RepID=UPI0004072B78|nr:hypothetical protein [Schaalia suimastitidis]
MGSLVALNVGAQTRAAHVVFNCQSELLDGMETLVDEADTLLPGVSTSGSQALREALTLWTESVAVVCHDLGAYGGALQMLDQDMAAAEQRNATSLARLTERLGGPVGS